MRIARALACGVRMPGLGIDFTFVRPPLRPEDPRFMGATLGQIRQALNFAQHSDFRWLLVVPPLPWLAGLMAPASARLRASA